MSYFTQAIIADDPYMRLRVSAAAAQQGVAETAGLDPDMWTLEWRKVWASSPGWDAAWESAQAGNVQTPGMDPGVITDGMILSQVQVMMPFRTVESHKPEMNPQAQASREFVSQSLEPVNQMIQDLRGRTVPNRAWTELQIAEWLMNRGVYDPNLENQPKDDLLRQAQEVLDASK